MLIVCPICGREYEVAEKFRGKRARCLVCRTLFVANEALLANQKPKAKVERLDLSAQIAEVDQIVSWKSWQNDSPVQKPAEMPTLLARPVIVERSYVEAAKRVLLPFEDEFRDKESQWAAANDEFNRLQKLERSQVRADWVRQNRLWLILWIGAGCCLLGGLSAILVGSSVGAGPRVVVFILISIIGYLGSFLGVQVFLAIVPSDLSATRQELTRLSETREIMANQYRAAEKPYLVAREQYEWFKDAFQSRLNQLLLTDWRSLRGYDFETFLIAIFGELGYRVTQIGGAGDQGVDLLVSVGNDKVAVQAKGYAHPVSNKAIQEVVTGSIVHGCSRRLVITNSSFTTGAVEAAQATDCLLVDGSRIEDLIRGRII
jgi:restriction system protein